MWINEHFSVISQASHTHLNKIKGLAQDAKTKSSSIILNLYRISALILPVSTGLPDFTIPYTAWRFTCFPENLNWTCHTTTWLYKLVHLNFTRIWAHLPWLYLMVAYLRLQCIIKSLNLPIWILRIPLLLSNNNILLKLKGKS